jgi:hypothetical protein
MAVLLIKSHQGSTVERASLVSKIALRSRFSAVVLNDTVGGLNPAAVRLALCMGAKKSGCRPAPHETTGGPVEKAMKGSKSSMGTAD